MGWISATVLGGRNIAEILPSLVHSSSAEGWPGQLFNNNELESENILFTIRCEMFLKKSHQIFSIWLNHYSIFSGVFQNKCVVEPPKNLNISYSKFISDSENWLEFGLCGNLTGSRKCPPGYICLPNIEDAHSEAHFEDFISSFINSLSFVTHDYWGAIFDQILTATGPLSSFFFVPVTFFGSFCLLNLMLIVVISTYEAMVSANEAKYQELSIYTYHSYFQFDISRISLYPFPANRETLRKVFRERDDLVSHREAVQQTWEMMKNVINLSQNIQQKMEMKRARNKVIFIPKSERNIQNTEQTILGRWVNFTQKVQTISESSSFRWFILLTVCINAIFLASEHANMSPKIDRILDVGNMVCVTIFSVEILIWLIAIGLHYFLSIWNLLDLIVVILGIISISKNTLKHTTGFRLFKLLNLLKFQKVWPALQRVSTVIVNSLGRIVRLIIVVSLLIFVFAIIGNRVLGPLYQHSNSSVPLRWSFTTFEESLFMVLWIFTGEWIEGLWHCMHATGSSDLCTIFFVSYYLVGNLVIISVFAALLLRSFSDLDLHFSTEKKFTFKLCCTYIWNCMSAFFHLKQKKSNVDEDKKNCEISTKKTTDEFYTEIKQKQTLHHLSPNCHRLLGLAPKDSWLGIVG
ncbi:Sodium channel protein type 11 subunit alpha [Araneus ventricosus]|uniref:Sodium channel protein type 11 subunit alpha n=1 Tax=Araneus ventricosus TaxID=182803 RepID=A0A4Y2HXZ7_ARAVE|nr:Sodium channel protein type 11 subunit alpha [Araneus ventricosus]